MVVPHSHNRHILSAHLGTNSNNVQSTYNVLDTPFQRNKMEGLFFLCWKVVLEDGIKVIGDNEVDEIG